ncbi:4'-phosphopantetheinyl transferase superfamily protein [Pedobacter aquatilis]|uniref:4'-phosphopantetheinyl transferase family protein n=1 Tax=Pedobacter aquatilis TaxID=351343 RepID=UPI0025B3A76F|nr:4'-phosphopantetheinyl transferase superfamily protein [Pedobacter aquatilis]MDN3585633.1 4'-phosphopantetheinyl transferase superfamily protein [Pedobacter aquatilis]
MLGNDIVDLVLAKTQSNWQRKGYLSKIFTSEEESLILSSKNPDTMVWLLWSMKEAAYKINNRQTGIRNFAPKDLKCDLLHATVNINNQIYHTKSSINTAYIHTVSAINLERLENIRTSIYQVPDFPGHYKESNPASTSHHGRYLALVY